MQATFSTAQHMARRTISRSEFQSYLERSSFDPFTINLRGKNLMEVIEEAVKAKSKRHPNYNKQLSCLRNNLNLLQDSFHTELKTVQITDVFWDYFIHFCSERGLQASTIITMANQLRSILNWATKYNATVSPSYADVVFPRCFSQEIALSLDEFFKIRFFDVDKFYEKSRKDYRETMGRVRDMFVLSCNLFQRHSDMVRITKECFDRNQFKIIQQKTGNKAIVDIDRFSIDSNSTYEILEKYNYTAPYKGDISNYNHKLHKLMFDIGFTNCVRIESRKCGELVYESVPKWKLITSHTARRTAITINVLRGYNVHSLRRCSGHTDLRIFDSYIRDEQ